MFGYSFPVSAKIILAPLKIKALAVDTKVNEGMITSSPGSIPARIAAISSAPVQECVNNTFLNPYFSSTSSWHFLVYKPLPESFPVKLALVI